MEIMELGKNGLSGALVAIIWYLIHQKQSKNGSNGKHDFMERLGEMMHQQAVVLKGISDSMGKIEPIVVAVNPVTNFPRIWADSPSETQTTQDISTILDIQEELVKVVTETSLKVDKLHANI